MSAPQRTEDGLQAMTESSRFNGRRWALVSGVLWLSVMATALAPAAEVGAELSRRETFIGLPITLRIQIRDVADYQPPKIPEIAGLEIESLGSPTRSSSIQIINGRRSQQESVTFSYRVTPQREGTFTIAPITVTADGLSQIIAPARLVVSKSEKTDLIFAEIAGSKPEVYVGEPLEVTLKIWVRPYRSEQHNIVLNEGDMWKLIADQSDWGVFQDRLDEIAEDDHRPAGREVVRKDTDGNEHNYYLYEIDATIYPKRPGKIDAEPVRVIARYPTELGRSRGPFSSFFEDDFPFQGSRPSTDRFSSPFGSRLTIRSTRAVIAEAEIDPIEVKPIPVAGRPADFRGAVGQYEITVEAKPTEVTAGDPIRLQIGIVGTGPMDLVQAPPLSELPELTADFRVPAGSLPGYVEGERKVFSTTIRPRNDEVTEIPPVAFTYFDPDTETFTTVTSDPIPVQVAKADTLALDAVVTGASGSSGRSAGTKGSADAKDSAGNANALPRLWLEHPQSGRRLLRSEQPQPFWSGPVVAFATAPPLLFLLLTLVRHRRTVYGVAAAWESSQRQCRRRIERAETPEAVAAALRALVARRYRLGAEAASAPEVVGALRIAGHRELAISWERILDRCERASRSDFPAGPVDLEELKDEAAQLVRQWPPPRRWLAHPAKLDRPLGGGARRRSGTTWILAWGLILSAAPISSLAASDSSPAASSPAASDRRESNRSETSVDLTIPQQRTLLEEADQRYRQGRRQARQGDAAAKKAFAQAAEKYQTVVDSGVRNGELYFYLGNAYLQSGETGRAIANYRRALRLRPTEQRYQANLEFAQQARGRASHAATAGTGTFGGRFPSLISQLQGSIPLRFAFWGGFAAWALFWGVLILRVYGVAVAWKSIATAALLVAVTMTFFYADRYRELTREGVGVVVTDRVTLREGDGDHFASVAEWSDAEGELVEVLRNRAGWVKVRIAPDRIGWIPQNTLEIVW